MVYRPKKREPREVIHNAIKKHAGLSDFDDEMIAHETAYIVTLRPRGSEGTANFLMTSEEVIEVINDRQQVFPTMRFRIFNVTEGKIVTKQFIEQLEVSDD